MPPTRMTSLTSRRWPLHQHRSEGSYNGPRFTLHEGQPEIPMRTSNPKVAVFGTWSIGSDEGQVDFGLSR
jgi:hypothetical protein